MSETNVRSPAGLPATDWREEIAPDETERFTHYAEQLRALQRDRAKKSSKGAADRALHAKGQAGVEGEFTVLPELPEYARVGLFAEPKTYRAYVRFSNGAGARQHDAKDDVRGIAIKLVGVDGKKIIPGMEDAKTQDFLAILSAFTPFVGPHEFVTVVRAAANPALLLPRLIKGLGFGPSFKLLKKLAGGFPKIASVATATYYSALPIQFGPYAVHYALRAQSKAEPVSGKKAADHFGAELADHLRKGPVVYDFRVQFFRDEKTTPIEDASVEWRESDAPFLTIARLTIPQQDPSSAKGVKLASFIEGLSFDPWHAQVELKPLGAMMRARNFAYRLSTEERKAAKEPDGTEEL